MVLEHVKKYGGTFKFSFDLKRSLFCKDKNEGIFITDR